MARGRLIAEFEMIRAASVIAYEVTRPTICLVIGVRAVDYTVTVTFLFVCVLSVVTAEVICNVSKIK